MPIRNSKDTYGPYYAWRTSGTKYYYIPGHKKSRENAKNAALEQMRAAYANGYKGQHGYKK